MKSNNKNRTTDYQIMALPDNFKIAMIYISKKVRKREFPQKTGTYFVKKRTFTSVFREG